VSNALDRRAQRLVGVGHATAKDGFINIPHRTVAVLERQEVERVGKEMAAERGLTYAPSGPGEYVTGRLAGVATLTSGRFARSRTAFQLMRWQPVLEKRIDQYISGVRRADGGIEWGFGRKDNSGWGYDRLRKRRRIAVAIGRPPRCALCPNAAAVSALQNPLSPTFHLTKACNLQHCHNSR
jgi:hypothetical protein